MTQLKRQREETGTTRALGTTRAMGPTRKRTQDGAHYGTKGQPVKGGSSVTNNSGDPSPDEIKDYTDPSRRRCRCPVLRRGVPSRGWSVVQDRPLIHSR